MRSYEQPHSLWRKRVIPIMIFFDGKGYNKGEDKALGQPRGGRIKGDGFTERRNEGIKQRRHGQAKVSYSSAGTRKYWKSLKRRVFSQVREQKSSVPGDL